MKIPKPLAHWATLATLLFTAAPFGAHPWLEPFRSPHTRKTRSRCRRPK